MSTCSMSIEMDQAVTRPPQEVPAAYLHLVDTRSNNQSQRTFSMGAEISYDTYDLFRQWQLLT